MNKYRKKSVVIEAKQWWLPQHPHPQVQEGRFDSTGSCKNCEMAMTRHGWVQTLEGGHIVCPGDVIIQGVKGEFYPCKPDIFNETYEEVK